MTENQIVLWGCLAAMFAFMIYETFIAKPKEKSAEDKGDKTDC